MAADSADSNPIVVATDATFPPFELEKDGKLEGFDIDMIKAIAKAENLNIKLKTMPFDGIIPSLKEIGRAHVELQSLIRISYAVFCLKKKIYVQTEYIQTITDITTNTLHN